MPTGEIAPGEKDLVQIRLEMPVTAVPGERFIVRSYSPQMTIAGGVVDRQLSTETSTERPRANTQVI